MDYGLEQAGMETVWQVEFDDWTREVALPQNFPNTEKFKDVREVGKHNLKHVDLIAGGFPCQDLSISNQHNSKGLDGERSGLWSEFARIIRELRPRYIVIENVPTLAVRGLDRVLSDLAAIGYDAEWRTLFAAQFELPHYRERLFIVAYTRRERSTQVSVLHAANPKSRSPWRANGSSVYLESFGSFYPQIPEHLRVDDGTAYELSEIERAIKAYGNGVAVPVAKWIGEQIMRFDADERRQHED